eukprot:Skav217889  [mRNA]  locus=scaffold67:211137:212157:+ [translate_table: standard]
MDWCSCACWKGLTWFQEEQRRHRSSSIPLDSIISERLQGLQGDDRDHRPSRPSPGLRGWSDGEPWLFRLRASEYMKTRQKLRSAETFYSCVGVEVLQAPCQLHSCMQGLSLQRSAHRSTLPKILLIHFLLPFKPGPIYGSHPADDSGCSVVIFFKLKEPVLASPALGLLQRFLEADHPKLRGQLPKSVMQLGILVQGVEDFELPEGFLGVARLDGLDLLKGRAVEIPTSLTPLPRSASPEGKDCGAGSEATLRRAWCCCRRKSLAG